MQKILSPNLSNWVWDEPKMMDVFSPGQNLQSLNVLDFQVQIWASETPQTKKVTHLNPRWNIIHNSIARILKCMFAFIVDLQVQKGRGEKNKKK